MGMIPRVVALPEVIARQESADELLLQADAIPVTGQKHQNGDGAQMVLEHCATPVVYTMLS